MKRYTLFLTILIPFLASAQTYRYIDKAGTIHWVESLKEVPLEYQDQIIPPTPTFSGKAAKEAEREYKKEIAEKKKEFERKKREFEKAKIEKEKKIKAEQKKLEKEEKKRKREEEIKEKKRKREEEKKDRLEASKQAKQKERTKTQKIIPKPTFEPTVAKLDQEETDDSGESE